MERLRPTNTSITIFKSYFLFFALFFALSNYTHAQDSDGDGVADTADLDDDNDGILDSIECTAGGGSGSIVAVSQTVNGMDNLPVTIDGLNCSTSPNEIDFNLTPFTFNSGALVSNLTVYVKFDVLDLDGGCSGSPNRSFPNELAIKLMSAQGTEITLIDYGDYSSSGNTFSDIEIVFDDAAVNGLVGSSPASGTFRPKESLNNLNGEIANGSWTVTAGDDFLEDPLVIEDFSITVTVQETDTDGDGIPNCLDLDSDNDGVYDVDEAGGTDANNDGRADDDDDNADNTSSDGIPTSAGTGIIPIETTSGTPDFLNLDSDDDGCSDANEAYDDANADGGDGGQFGTGNPATVNPANGLVTATGVDYSLGTNAAVTTATTDIDSDGLVGACDDDDDGDGVTDAQEVIDGTDPLDSCEFDIDSTTETPSAAWNALDCDGDGVTNGTEVTDGTDPGDNCEFDIDSATETPSSAWNALDCDGDGVTNGTEVTDGTDPLDSCEFDIDSATETPSAAWNALDCDGDGVINGTEVTDNTDPNDGCQYNVNNRTVTPSAEWEALDCDNDGNPNGTDPNTFTAVETLQLER